MTDQLSVESGTETFSFSECSPNQQASARNERLLQVQLSIDKFSVSPRSPLYSTAIEENLWFCGRNSHGQLGLRDLGKEVKTVQPIKGGVKRVSLVSLGESHTGAVTCDGELFMWGCNEQGQLGLNDVQSNTQPQQVPQFQGVTVRGVSCGDSHSLAITDNDVIAWGSNEQGQLGYGESSPAQSNKPYILRSLHSILVHQVACGRAHSLCVTVQSHVYAWGCNLEGQLGLGDRYNRKTPTMVDSLWALPICQLEAGSDHSLALTSNGFLFAWGDNKEGQLGVNADAELAGKEERRIDRDLVKKEIAKKVDQSMVENMMTMGITKENAELALYHTKFIYSPHWNRVVKQLEDFDASFSNNSNVSVNKSAPNSDGEGSSGDEVGRQHSLPRRVPLKGVQYIATGNHHSIAITGRNAYAWGCNTHGQLGLGHQQVVYQPTKISSLKGKHIQSAACGEAHTLFLSRNGDVFGAGSFDFGQLGNQEKQGDLPLLLTPARLSIPLPKGQVINSVVAGGNASMFVTRGSSEIPLQVGPIPLSRRLSSTLQDFETRNVMENISNTDISPLIQMLKLVYSSAAALTAAFGKPNGAGISYDLMEYVQQRLMEMDEALMKGEEESDKGEGEEGETKQGPIATEILQCVGQVVGSLEAHHKLLGVHERVQVVLVFLQLPMLPNNKVGRENIPLLAQVVLMAPLGARRLLVRQWCEIPVEPLKRMVQALQWFLTDDLMKFKKLKPATMNTIKLLSKIEQANRMRKASVRLPPETFYNWLISEKMDVMDHYSAWRQSREEVKARNRTHEGPFSFCSYPFLLDAKAKSKLLHTEAKIRMQQTVVEAKIEQMYSPFKAQNHTTLQDGLFGKSEKVPIGKSQSSSNRENKNSGRDGNRRRRADLRRILYGMIGRASSSASDDVSDDERRIVARELSHTELVPRQTSLNFPAPVDCSVPEIHPEFCILRIRRNHLVEDAANEIARQKVKDLFKPLRVHFIGEDGIDAGGVKKEFFQLLATELLSPEYGLLVYLPESRTYWLNSASKDMLEEFKFLGVTLGLAIYNGVILDLPLPIPLYKKILKQHTTLQDLQEMQPTVANSLQYLLEYNDAVQPMEDVLCQTFTISEEHYGEVKEFQLIENGDNVYVTEENRLEYVNLYVDWVLDKSVKAQFESLLMGFMQFYDGPAITLFSAEELDRLVCGTPQLDFQALKEKSRHEGDYTETSRAVKWLWEIVFGFTDEEGKMFLKFFTGSSRAPIGGLGNLRCVIQRDGCDSNKLPTSHTCFNTLLLPDYDSKTKMERLLKLAIMNSEGFGLE